MSDPSESVRAFVALDLGSEATAAVLESQRALGLELARGAVRWTKPDQLHLTLRFLGNVPASRLVELEQALKTALSGTGVIHLRLGGLGAFPSLRSPRVIWVDLGGDLPQLLDLHRRATQASTGFGDHEEEREFHPHLTIGRVSRTDSRMARLLQDYISGRPAPPPSEWEVIALRLMRSRLLPTGAVHSELTRFDLA